MWKVSICTGSVELGQKIAADPPPSCGSILVTAASATVKMHRIRVIVIALAGKLMFIAGYYN